MEQSGGTPLQQADLNKKRKKTLMGFFRCYLSSRYRIILCSEEKILLCSFYNRKAA